MEKKSKIGCEMRYFGIWSNYQLLRRKTTAEVPSKRGRWMGSEDKSDMDDICPQFTKKAIQEKKRKEAIRPFQA